MRYLTDFIQKDLQKKMVWISGPRQCGKTTLAKGLLNKYQSGVYLNWDDSEDKKIILGRKWSEMDRLIVLDEIHKYPKWKAWLKGVYDKSHELHRFLVTGSARLDVYRRGGDSLLGRYHAWRLHPFCLAEHPSKFSPQKAFRLLMEVGGFPEPFLGGDVTEAKRWRRERRNLVIREDIRDLEPVREITLLSLLIDLLSTRVGGTIAYSNLAEDLQVAPKTVKHWIELLERMYLLFTIRPYSQNLPRALLKSPKVYFFDNADVEGEKDQGPRFENLVATHLLKRLNFLEDSTGDRFELNFLRDKEGHETDFVILKNRKPVALVEAKWSDSQPSPSLVYFGAKLKVTNLIQVVAEPKRTGQFNGVHVVKAVEWLGMPLDDEFWKMK